ncbi:MAG: hypothetical protein WAZ34_12430 [Rhodocyclaceae bacterium]
MSTSQPNIQMKKLLLFVVALAVSGIAISEPRRDCSIQSALAEAIAREARAKHINPMDTSVVQSAVRNGFREEVSFLAISTDIMRNFPLQSVGEYFGFACLWDLTGTDIKGMAARATEICSQPGHNKSERGQIECLGAFLGGVAQSFRHKEAAREIVR